METDKNYNDLRLWQNKYSNNANILYVIKQKMKNDEKLSLLMELFAAEDNDTARMKIIEDILIYFTESENINPKTKGKTVNLKFLHVLEYLDKQKLISFSQKSNWNSGSKIELKDVVEREFENLKIEMYVKLMQQVYCKKKYNLNTKDSIKST